MSEGNIYGGNKTLHSSLLATDSVLLWERSSLVTIDNVRSKRKSTYRDTNPFLRGKALNLRGKTIGQRHPNLLPLL
jgi:hypothetical protein